LAVPALTRSLVPVAQECSVSAESFGHAPVPISADERLSLVPNGQGFRLTWHGLVVDLVWQTLPDVGLLSLSGIDELGVRYEASLGPDGSFVLVGRPGGIDYGLIATCTMPPPR
jgi:hypothetical protein